MFIDTPSFTVAAVLAVLIGSAFIWNLTQKWRNTENALNKPMSITLRTEKTPAELILDARVARTKRRFTYFVVFVAVWVFLRLRYPEVAYSLETMMMTVLETLFRGIAGLFDFLADLL